MWSPKLRWRLKTIGTLQDKHQIQLAYLRQATTFLVQATMELEFSLKTTIGSLMIPSQKPEELQWQWRPHPIQLLFLSDQLENEIRDGTYRELLRSRDLTLLDSSSDSSSEGEATSRRREVRTERSELRSEPRGQNREVRTEV